MRVHLLNYQMPSQRGAQVGEWPQRGDLAVGGEDGHAPGAVRSGLSPRARPQPLGTSPSSSHWETGQNMGKTIQTVDSRQ